MGHLSQQSERSAPVSPSSSSSDSVERELVI